MSILIAMFLGAIQGLTEFLPVSSSGHLTLFQALFNIETESNLLFNILMHIATLLAVCIVFRKQVLEVIKNPLKPFSLMLACATAITIIMVLIFKPLINQTLGGQWLAISFLTTAILLTVTTKLQKNKFKKDKDINYKTACVMGVAQGLAVIPGISRSGATICGGLLMGAERDQTANFSFLLSIPIILASFVYELVFGATSSSLQVLPAIFGFVFAFVFGLIAIKLMLKIIKKGNYLPFAIYLFILSVMLFVFPL